MTDYLASLVARAIVSTTDVQPRVTPLFGPAQAGAVAPLADAGQYDEDTGVDIELAERRDSRPAISWSHTRDNVARTEGAPTTAEIRTFQPSDRPSRPIAGERPVLSPASPPPAPSTLLGDVPAAADRPSVVDVATHQSAVADRVPPPTARVVTASSEPPVIRRRLARTRIERRTRPQETAASIHSDRVALPHSVLAPEVALPHSVLAPETESAYETRTMQGRPAQLSSTPREAAARNVRVSDRQEHHVIQPRGVVVPVPALLERPKQAVPAQARAVEESTAGRTVQVTIGRLEVRVAASATARKPARVQQPSMSLEEYVRSRKGGGGQ
jgi:hypothetical protein